MATKKKSKAKTSNGRKAKALRKPRKQSPKVTITGTLEALKDLAVDLSKVPGLMIKRAGF